MTIYALQRRRLIYEDDAEKIHTCKRGAEGVAKGACNVPQAGDDIGPGSGPGFWRIFSFPCVLHTL